MANVRGSIVECSSELVEVMLLNAVNRDKVRRKFTSLIVGARFGAQNSLDNIFHGCFFGKINLIRGVNQWLGRKKMSPVWSCELVWKCESHVLSKRITRWQFDGKWYFVFHEKLVKMKYDGFPSTIW